ncbi:MAG: FtsQ-type POTRA domain-containing protein [Bryobacteraceae bacterium]
MPRKLNDSSGMLPGMEEMDERRSMRLRERGLDADNLPRVRVKPAKPSQRAVVAARVRLGVRVGAVVAVLLGVVYVLHTTEQFLIRDSRFAMVGSDGSPDSYKVEVRGASHASSRTIQEIFSDDIGHSVFVLPMDERRAALRKVDWVKDASVARVWPNRVYVSVSERTPVAFVPLSESKFGLIDEDGVILPTAADRFHLPVLRGVSPADTAANRRERVHRMLRLVQELGAMADKISEVDIAEKENLKVKQQYEGRMVTLLLGDQNFGARYKNFLNHYGEIKQKLPGAGMLDLRLEDRITVVEP